MNTSEALDNKPSFAEALALIDTLQGQQEPLQNALKKAENDRDEYRKLYERVFLDLKRKTPTKQRLVPCFYDT
jgi:hypothetical protein